MSPKPSIRVRPFRIADYPAALALWKDSEGIGLNESDTREAVGRVLKRNPGLSQVATIGGRVVATVLCGHDGRRGYLHHLAVARRSRRKGVGKGLVEVCLERLRKEGIPKCNLFLYASNRPGRMFWRGLGWNVRSDLRLVQRRTAGPIGDCKESC